MVVPAGVQGEVADQVADVAVNDANLEVVDEQGDGGAGESGAEADVVQPAVVAESDRSAGVESTATSATAAKHLRPSLPVVRSSADAVGILVLATKRAII